MAKAVAVAFFFSATLSADGARQVHSKGKEAETEIMDLNDVANLTESTGRAEDVECFCIDPYIYADLDDADYKKDPWAECVGDYGERQGGFRNKGLRCNEICEDDKKFVFFEGKRQTLSFCGTDNGGFNGKIECQCLDGNDTYGNPTNKKVAQKRYQKGKISNPNTLWMLHVKENYAHGRTAQDNLKQCYQECPNVCRQNEMIIGGCAMPADA